ncbi:MAG: tetratricopeptide repeat protein [Candidatus Obscuribacterales bacterium]|nr:tetratricopeptide repeat protein [Candidatus Obscuribacterales bacterium]
MTNANHHGENDDSLEPVEEKAEQGAQENRSAMEKRFSVTGFPSPPPDRANKPGVKKITQLEWLMPDYDKQEVPEPVKEIANLAEEIETAAGVQRKLQEVPASEPAQLNPLNEPYPKRATQTSTQAESAAQELKQRPEAAPENQEVRQSPQAYLQNGSTEQDLQSNQYFDNLDATRVPPLPRSLATPADLENTMPSRDNAQSRKNQAQEDAPAYSKEALAAIPTPRATTETKRPITETKRPLTEEPSEPVIRKSRLPRSFTKGEKYSQEEHPQEEEAETKGARKTRSLSRSIERPSALGGIFESRRSKITAILVGSIALGFTIGLTAFLAMPRSDKEKDREFARDTNTTKATISAERKAGQAQSPSLPFLKLDTSYKTIEEAEVGFDEAVSKGELNDAQKAIDQAQKLAPESLGFQEKQGLLHHLKGDSESALQVLNDVLQKSPRHLPALFDRAFIYFSQGKFKKAQLDYTLINAIEPGNENALLGLALCKLKTGETEAGLSTLSKITAENPANTLAHRAAGEEFLKDGDYERAVSAFSRALDTTSPDAEILALRARAYLLGGNKEKAVADYAEAISLQSKPEWKADLEIAKSQP